MRFRFDNNSSQDLIEVNLMSLVKRVIPPTVVTILAGNSHEFQAEDFDTSAIISRVKTFCVLHDIPYGMPDGARIIQLSDTEEE